MTPQYYLSLSPYFLLSLALWLYLRLSNCTVACRRVFSFLDLFFGELIVRFFYATRSFLHSYLLHDYLYGVRDEQKYNYTSFRVLALLESLVCRWNENMCKFNVMYIVLRPMYYGYQWYHRLWLYLTLISHTIYGDICFNYNDLSDFWLVSYFFSQIINNNHSDLKWQRAFQIYEQL